MHAYNLATRRDLGAFARLLIPILERKARGFAECWSSNETLASALGCCERTLRHALDQLEHSGLILRIRDYSLKSRRRIKLLWKECRDLFSSSVAADTSPDLEAHFAASSEVPPHPPIEVPEGSSEKESDVEPQPTALETPLPSCPPQKPQQEERRKATPAEVDAAAVKAAPILRVDTPTARARVVALAKRWGLSWVVAALERAEVKAAQEPLRNPSGYVVRTLEGFQAEGGPPAPPPAPISDAEFMARLDAVEAERRAFIESLS